MQTIQTTFYADQVNGQFHKHASHYVNVSERLESVIESDEYIKSILEDAVEEFTRRHPTIKKWSDLHLCKALSAKMSEIDIDCTLQRLLDMKHGIGILDKFAEAMVKAIYVYEDPSRPGRYICWDSQHTLVVLFIIAAKALNEDFRDCVVPIVITPGSQKKSIRECLISHATDATKPFDQIDLFQQKVFGVRADGNTRQDWIIAERKQVALENSKMFATNEKFGDHRQPGALTVLTELSSDNYNVTITEHFCKYFMRVCKSSRPVKPKESWMLYDYFKICESVGIEVNDDYIRKVAKSLQVVGNNDFDSDALYRRAKQSFQDWWRINCPATDDSTRGIKYHEKMIGATFLMEQIRKGFNGNGIVPKFKDLLWVVPKEDLF